MTSARARARMVCCVMTLWASSGCSGDPDESLNVLPDFRPRPDMGQVDASGGTGGMGGTGGTAGTGGGVDPGSMFPRGYRFECIHIDKLGENQPNGAPPLQAGVLNRLWVSDIKKHRLNILIGIDSLDTTSSIAQVYIGSGVGLDDATQCREPTTDGTRFDAELQAGVSTYVAAPPEDSSTCALPAPAGTASFGTVDVQVPSTGAIFIYAQDEKGVYFNCTPDPVLPNAVPLREVRAAVTLTPDTGRLAGELTACLLQSDIAKLCSCIGACAATSLDDVIPDGEECGGCPKGGIALSKQLMGIISSPDCEARTGGAAYELKASFHAIALPSAPEVCE